jgi:hypothetical protein
MNETELQDLKTKVNFLYKGHMIAIALIVVAIGVYYIKKK